MQYQPVPENKQCYYKPVYFMGLMGRGEKPVSSELTHEPLN
jgi:hypothetical protein